jgi:hypothetical protein
VPSLQVAVTGVCACAITVVPKLATIARANKNAFMSSASRLPDESGHRPVEKQICTVGALRAKPYSPQAYFLLNAQTEVHQRAERFEDHWQAGSTLHYRLVSRHFCACSLIFMQRNGLALGRHNYPYKDICGCLLTVVNCLPYPNGGTAMFIMICYWADM